jgi:hypothetical protein
MACLCTVDSVGDWMGEGCPSATEINGTLFRRGGMFPHPTLWLYGNHDPFYSLDHSRTNFAAFQAAGGKDSFFDFEVPAGLAQGDVSTAALDRPRRSLSQRDRCGGETIAVLFFTGPGTAASSDRPSPLPADTGQ